MFSEFKKKETAGLHKDIQHHEQLDPFRTSVRITYSFLKAYWNAFLTPLHTQSARKCQELNAAEV